MTHMKAEEQITLLSAATAPRRAAMGARAQELGATLDWARLLKMLRFRRLLATLGPRILELAPAQAGAGFDAAVADALEAGRRQGAFLQLVGTRAIGALADAGIRSAPLKGPALSEAIYGDPGRRLSGDIDLLVAPEQLRDAVDVVRGLGYDAPGDYVEDGGLPLLHFALVHARGELPPVELHWRIHWYEQRFAAERLLPPSVSAEPSWRPAPSAELAALLLFYARDGFIDLRLATDLSAWWDAFGEQLAPGALDELARDYPNLARVLRVSAGAAERIVGLPAARVLSGPGLGRRGRLAVRLANPNPRGSESQLYADMGLVDGLLTPPGGFGAFVRRQVVLPREVLEERARRSSRWWVKSPIPRGIGVVARYGVTMTRLLRPPDGLPPARS
jgi:hypothetical protein